MRKKQLILIFLINFVIFISILFAALSVSVSYSQVANNPYENERNLLIPNQNQISNGNCEKISGFDDYFGVFEDVFVEGSIAYIISISEGLYIYDVSNVNNPTLLSTWSYDNDALGYYTIFIASDYAYLINDLGFTIIDISSPSSPAFIGNYSSANFLCDIFVEGDYAYFVVSGVGLHIIDISDKANPSYVSELSITNPISVYKEGNVVCVAGPSVGLVTVNVTDKANPAELDSAYYSSHSIRVCVNNDYAYVAAGDEGVYIHNIADPTNILLEQQFLHPTQPDNAFDVQVSNDLIYVSNGYHFYILDVDSLEGSFTDGEYGFSSVEGDFAYFILQSEGCQILNISDPTAIEIVNEIYFGGAHRGIYIEGNYAYVGLSSYGLGIYDISNPQNPSKVGDLRYELPNNAYPSQLVVDGNYAYLADGSNGLVVVDVSDKSNPINISSYYVYNLRDIAIQNYYAYIVGDFDRMQILDISDPMNLVEVSNLTIQDEMCRSIAIEGDYVFISNRDAGDLMTVDVSNILYPTIVNRTDIFPGTPYNLAVYGNYVYISNSYSMIIYNTADKSNPVEVGRKDFNFIEFIYTNGTVTCASGDDTIRVYDTSDKTNPTLIAEYYDDTDFGDLYLTNNLIYAANMFDGLTIIGFVEDTQPTTTNGFGFNFLTVFILATIILGYGLVKRKKEK